MAAAVGRICKTGLLQPRNLNCRQQISKLSTSTWSKGQKRLFTTVGALAGGAGALLLTLDQSVKAYDLTLHPPKMPWPHSGLFDSLDHASIRRGWEVYKQVCAACHSMEYLYYRQMVGVFLTEEEAKAEAEEAQIKDGPNSIGEFFLRPGKLSDPVPAPYPNEEAARAANNGAYPPDLSLIQLARHGNEDYLFHLLTGYCDPPAGIEVREGMYYNPYFLGGSIGMAKALYDEIIEYSDGTPATTSQLAKDVSEFLTWAAQREHDDRKYIAIKVLLWGIPILLLTVYWKRFYWSSLKTRKIVYTPPPTKPK